MYHRGACACDNDTGDGAGVLTAIPHSLYAKELWVNMKKVKVDKRTQTRFIRKWRDFHWVNSDILNALFDKKFHIVTVIRICEWDLFKAQRESVFTPLPLTSLHIYDRNESFYEPSHEIIQCCAFLACRRYIDFVILSMSDAEIFLSQKKKNTSS